MNLAEDAYQMPTGMLLHEAERQFAMTEIVFDDLQRVLYERGGWFLLLVHAERTFGAPVGGRVVRRNWSGGLTEGPADGGVTPEIELPGMWERSDFEGGRDEVRGQDWKPPHDSGVGASDGEVTCTGKTK